VIIDQILPDGFGVTPAGKPQLNDFPPGLARAGRRGPTGNRIGCDRVFPGGLPAKVGDHLVGRFCRIAPTPGTGRPNGNTGGPQIAADRLPPDVYGLFNAPQRPAQPSQRDDLLSFYFAQDIAHVDGGYSSRQDQCPGSVAPLAGFQVITIGRFWVIPEGIGNPKFAETESFLREILTSNGELERLDRLQQEQQGLVARLAPDADRNQTDFMGEAPNLVFEKYGKPPIA
jgi:hypothetical protein